MSPFSRCARLIIIDITAIHFFKLRTGKGFKTDGEDVLGAGEKVVYCGPGPFGFPCREGYLFCVKHIHHFSQTCPGLLVRCLSDGSLMVHGKRFLPCLVLLAQDISRLS